MSDFTHFNDEGSAIMVDVSKKAETKRVAIAEGKIYLNEEAYMAVIGRKVKKGDVLGIARTAGIMGAKKTSGLIPLCHPLLLTSIEIDFELNDNDRSIKVISKVELVGKTGVEMEALMAVQIALLTIYDMCKAIDKRMRIDDVHLVSKTGGKSGSFLYKE